MTPKLGTLDLQWIRHFLSKSVVRGSEEDQLFHIVNKIDDILRKGNTDGDTREAQRATQ